MRPPITASLLALALAACGDRPADAAPAAVDAPADAAPARLTQAPFDLPSPDGAAQPDLVATPDGSLLLSWIEPNGDAGHALRFARHADGRWSAPRTIATGEDWFVNWADTPHIAATADGALWAHWLQKSAAATYAYDVALVRSADGGDSWSAPVLVNTDGTPTEHGFVSLWAAGVDRAGIAWLDGRAMQAPEGAEAHAGHGAGMMTLRTAVFDADLRRSGETRLDASTCDCCQTASAPTDRGHVLAYRDRTAGEIRDIHVARSTGDGWTEPRRVHADDWEMPACPVNGPSVAAHGNEVVVGWYTAAGGNPRVLLARSTDAGDSFGTPVELDAGPHVHGRISVAMDETGTWALWTTEDRDGQALQLARLAPDLSGEHQRLDPIALAGRGRGTGFPQIALTADAAIVAWTDVIDGATRLQAVRLVR
ncbi:hypothetical protein GCM10028862_21150 [Luteimonas pelagia]